MRDKHVAVGCTVLPRYIADVGVFLLRECENVTLSYSPEFIAQGDIMRGFVAPDLVLIGEASAAAGDRIEAVYRRTVHDTARYCRMSPTSAELTKLSINCERLFSLHRNESKLTRCAPGFITMKIAFANSIADVAHDTADASGADVLAAVGIDQRIGARCLKPGKSASTGCSFYLTGMP